MSGVRAVGIVGGSGSGKSTLVSALVRRLGAERVRVLEQDSYYRDLSYLPLEQRARTNFDAPESLDLERMGSDLTALLAGRPVRPPRYDMTTHTRAGVVESVLPGEIVIADGTLLLAEPSIGKSLDIIVFVDLPEARRLARRIRRDVQERGRTEASVREQWAATVLPMHRRHVAPVRQRADLIVSGAAPAGDSAKRIALTLLA